MTDGAKERRIGYTIMPSGRVVSTVKLLEEMSLADLTGGDYETMVFPAQDEFTEDYCQRYYTQEEAKEGHQAIVNKLMREPREMVIVSVDVWK